MSLSKYSATPHPLSGRRIAVIGTGYVGLTASACFAYLGHTVICSDVSRSRIDQLREGHVSIVEVGLPEMVHQMREMGRLDFTTDNAEAVRDAEFVFLCLPTPQGGDGRADLSFVCRAAEEIGPFLLPDTVVINKSTVPVGTAQLVHEALLRSDVHVVSNPEFLAEGTALDDFLNPDRVVVGSASAGAAVRVAELYGGLSTRVIVTDAASAETIKYASNAFLAMKLAFVNSLAALCEATGADIRPVAEGVGADHRIGSAFLRPGPGWGGSCFPKDVNALIQTARDAGAPFPILETVVAANLGHTQRVVDKVRQAVNGELSGAVVALWGLTFKAGTDDMRDSPARHMAADLVARGATVKAYDPAVSVDLADIEVCESALAACEGADVLLVATEWPEFAVVPLDQAAQVMAGLAIVDARNLLDQQLARSVGFRYEGIGITDQTSLELLDVNLDDAVAASAQ
jgi:UDPglucose 6-dehydrogenase